MGAAEETADFAALLRELKERSVVSRLNANGARTRSGYHQGGPGRL
ncbi:hypothetical protein [Streptomyces sp. NPDC093094]